MKGLKSILLFLSCMLLSCNDGGVKKSLKEFQSHQVKVRLEKMECRMHEQDTICIDSVKPMLRLVSYVDSSECTPCTLDHMYVWNDLIDEASKYEGKLKYIFIFAPKSGSYNLEDVHLAVASSGLKCPVYVDTAYSFKNDNPQLPADSRFHTMLLDSKDSVLMVGSPLDNPKIENLFSRIIKSVITNNLR